MQRKSNFNCNGNTDYKGFQIRLQIWCKYNWWNPPLLIGRNWNAWAFSFVFVLQLIVYINQRKNLETLRNLINDNWITENFDIKKLKKVYTLYFNFHLIVKIKKYKLWKTRKITSVYDVVYRTIKSDKLRWLIRIPVRLGANSPEFKSDTCKITVWITLMHSQCKRCVTNTRLKITAVCT